MEATTLVALSSILFLSFTTNGLPASRGISNIVHYHSDYPAVIDCDGNEVQSDQYYYLTPLITPPLPHRYKAALVPIIARDQTVWINLDVAKFKVTGLPVKFSPVSDTPEPSIEESINLTIKYPDELSPVSGGSSVWQLPIIIDSEVPPFVTLGGDGNNSSSFFQIEKAHRESAFDVYTLVSSIRNAKIGTSKRLGGRLVDLPPDGGGPLEFIIIPAGDETSASI